MSTAEILTPEVVSPPPAAATIVAVTAPVSRGVTNNPSPADLDDDRLLIRATQLYQRFTGAEKAAGEREREWLKAAHSLVAIQREFASLLHEKKRRLAAVRSNGWRKFCVEVGIHHEHADRLVRGYDAYLACPSVVQRAVEEAGASPHQPVIAKVLERLSAEALSGTVDPRSPDFLASCVEQLCTARKRGSVGGEVGKGGNGKGGNDPELVIFTQRTAKRYLNLPENIREVRFLALVATVSNALGFIVDGDLKSQIVIRPKPKKEEEKKKGKPV